MAMPYALASDFGPTLGLFFNTNCAVASEMSSESPKMTTLAGSLMVF